MEQTLTEDEIRTLYEYKQEEPFPEHKNVMGILLAVFFILVMIGICLALWAFLMHIFSGAGLPDDVIYTAML